MSNKRSDDWCDEVGLFAKAAWWLEDYADIYQSCIIIDDKDTDNIARRKGLLALANDLRELDGRHAQRASNTPGQNAAEAISYLLRKWNLPGTVYYSPIRRKFKLTAEGYHPLSGDICVGVYLPGAPVELMAEDFDFVLKGAKCS